MAACVFFCSTKKMATRKSAQKYIVHCTYKRTCDFMHIARIARESYSHSNNNNNKNGDADAGDAEQMNFILFTSSIVVLALHIIREE